MSTDTYTLYSEKKPEAKDFPIVVKWQDGYFGIIKERTDLIRVIHFSGTDPQTWAHFREPAMPPPPPPPPVDAFEEWCDSVPAGTGMKACWNAATERERKRFGEQVEKAVQEWIADDKGNSPRRLIDDLRRIAGGENI